MDFSLNKCGVIFTEFDTIDNDGIEVNTITAHLLSKMSRPVLYI